MPHQGIHMKRIEHRERVRKHFSKGKITVRSFRFTEDQNNKLMTLAETYNMTMSDVVFEAIDLYARIRSMKEF